MKTFAPTMTMYYSDDLVKRDVSSQLGKHALGSNVVDLGYPRRWVGCTHLNLLDMRECAGSFRKEQRCVIGCTSTYASGCSQSRGGGSWEWLSCKLSTPRRKKARAT